jgi:uncharacterized protein YlxW (UPF0749 family)
MSEGKPTYDELVALVGRLQAQNAQLQARIAELEEQLRQSHRQAAPFRQRETKKKPATRRSGPVASRDIRGITGPAPIMWTRRSRCR